MKFHESGLPENKTIEEAFDYSYTNAMSYKTEALKSFTQQIEMMHMQHVAMLDMEKINGNIREEDYKREKEAMDKMRDEQLQMGPLAVEDELNFMFQQRRLGPAQEIQSHSDKASPELIAAVLLIECVRSPIDYQRVAQKFGESVAGMIAEVHHIDAYPSERNTNLAQAGSDTKRAYMALLITSLDQIVEQSRMMAQMNPPQRIAFPPGQEEGLYENASLLWDNDKKLDARFVESFNKAAAATNSPFRMEVDAGNRLGLVKGTLTPPRNPNTPSSGPNAAGDDVF